MLTSSLIQELKKILKEKKQVIVYLHNSIALDGIIMSWGDNSLILHKQNNNNLCQCFINMDFVVSVLTMEYNNIIPLMNNKNIITFTTIVNYIEQLDKSIILDFYLESGIKITGQIDEICDNFLILLQEKNKYYIFFKSIVSIVFQLPTTSPNNQ